MKVKTITRNAHSFKKVLERIIVKSDYREILIKTLHETGYFTDAAGSFLSLMTTEEKEFVAKKHWDREAGQKKYKEAVPINIAALLPQYLGMSVYTATEVGGSGKFQVIQLGGAGKKVLVEARAFLTLRQRHPNAMWLFAGGEGYLTKPVILIEPVGCWYTGQVLGILPVIQAEEAHKELVGPKNWKRLQEDNIWRYARILVKSDKS